jgi:hypothetical protein
MHLTGKPFIKTQNLRLKRAKPIAANNIVAANF